MTENPYLEGLRAYYDGKELSDCPYERGRNAELWEEGFSDAADTVPGDEG